MWRNLSFPSKPCFYRVFSCPFSSKLSKPSQEMAKNVTFLLPELLPDMASIVKKPNGSYAVQYRLDGRQYKKTFKDRASATRFAKLAGLNPSTQSVRFTVAELFGLYRDQVTVYKRGARAEAIRIGRLMRCDFAKERVYALTRRHLQDYADRRVREKTKTGKPISAGTVIREFRTLSSIFSWAVERGYISENPAKGVHLPKQPDHRERVASDEDIKALLDASGWDGESPPANDTQLVMAAFLFSCRTGMRSGEILQTEACWIDGNVIHLPAKATKTLSRRDVALGKDARKILRLVRMATGDNLFQMRADVRDALWRKIRDRAGLGPVCDSHGNEIKEGLHFHDARATFATWAASPDPKTGVPRLDVMALARQTGHKDLKMLMRYYRQSAEQIAERLD